MAIGELIKVAAKRPAHTISYLLTSCCIMENIAAMSHYLYRHSVKPLNALIRVVAVVLYKLDVTFTRSLQLTLSATFLSNIPFNLTATLSYVTVNFNILTTFKSII